MGVREEIKDSFNRKKAALLERGLHVRRCSSETQLSAHLVGLGFARRGREPAGDHVRRYLGEFRSVRRADGEATGRAISPVDRGEYRPRRHPRLDEIEAVQPRMWTPDGVGNGAERQHGYGRGR